MNIFKWFITPQTESKQIDQSIEDAVSSYLQNMPLVKTRVISLELLDEDKDFIARQEKEGHFG